MRPGTIRVAVMSDLHLEFEHGDRIHLLQQRRHDGQPSIGPDWSEAREAGVDLVLLAGDIDAGATAELGITYARQVADWLGCPVAMCAGNHESYNRNRPYLMEELRAVSGRSEGVFFLERDEVAVETAAGWLRLLGCTLWTDFRLLGDARRQEVMDSARRRMTDYIDGIWEGNSRYTPERSAELHAESLGWLAERCAEPFAGPTIIMTHHAPSQRSVPPERRDNLLAAAYASALDAQVEALAPALWVHGHIHAPSDYNIAGTRVVCQPRGYVGHEPEARKKLPKIVDLKAGAAPGTPWDD